MKKNFREREKETDLFDFNLPMENRGYWRYLYNIYIGTYRWYNKSLKNQRRDSYLEMKRNVSDRENYIFFFINSFRKIPYFGKVEGG